MDDQRRYPRLSLRLPVSIASPGYSEGAPSFRGETADLSLGGLRLAINGRQDFKIGDQLALTIDVLVFRERVNAVGAVRWLSQEQSREGQVEIGVELTQMPGQDWSRWFQLMPWMAS